VALFGFVINRHFGGTCSLHLQVRCNFLTHFLARVISYALKMEVTCSSETSVYNKLTRRHIPKDGILYSHRCENLKSYITLWSSPLCSCLQIPVAFSPLGPNVPLSTLFSINFCLCSVNMGDQVACS
jgi:hypothetical protein